MPDANLVFLHALTGVHPGGGTALGVVDLPVQRERHTQWPMIAGSSLKGVLRDTCRQSLGDGPDGKDLLHAAFGPETGNASDFAGALAFTDARLLAFPVRSLRGVFAWTTCPAVLARFVRDAKLLAGSGSVPLDPPKVARGEAACPEGSDLLMDGDRLLLEEFEFRRSRCDGGIASWLAERALADQATADRLRRNLVVLDDNDFTHFARHATEVIARIGLDYETRTARGKALFYEEFIPPETLFYSVAFATASRNERLQCDAAEMLEVLRDNTPRVLQIGADQTIGKGLCAVRIIVNEANGEREVGDE